MAKFFVGCMLLFLNSTQTLYQFLNPMASSTPNNDNDNDFQSIPLSSTSNWNSDDGWKIHFPDDVEGEAKADTERVDTIRKLTRLFTSDIGLELLQSIPEDSYSFSLNYAVLKGEQSAQILRDIAKKLEDNPDEVLRQIALATARAADNLVENKSMMESTLAVPEQRIVPRIFNYSPLSTIRNLRAASVGKFVAIRGTVVRSSNIRQQLASIRFSCFKCGEEQTLSFSDFKYQVPRSCPTPKCRGRTFEPLYDSAETVDWQRIRLQEIQDRDDHTREEGRMPRTLDVELCTADLIDKCIPGDIVVVNGIVRVLLLEEGGGGSSSRAANSLYKLYVEANSITNSSRKGEDLMMAKLEMSQVQLLIREILNHANTFELLVKSSVPSIFGHELVKTGMLLALFGGASKKRTNDNEKVSVRPDIHVLVVGDPGLGKSQCLKAMARIAPRSVFVSSSTSTNAGLTCTVVREASGDFALEAGALVLGDRGVCCIDEFDKMGAEHAALLEGMEQQSVSVAKAGLVCNLSARTTVLAAANPVGGSYDRSRTVSENLKMAQPLLSRFDLVYILMDNADTERDRFISEHIMSMFGMRNTRLPSSYVSGQARTGGASTQPGQLPRAPTQPNDHFIPPLGSQQPQPQVEMEDENRQSLLDRIRSTRIRDPIPASVFRQYIAYAREHCHPELSQGAKDLIQEFYLRLRKGAKEQDTTPVTTRQLESLIRLSEARARAEMRTIVTEDDARDVIEVMRQSMLETLTDEHGAIDLGRSNGMSRSKDVRAYVKALNAEATRSRSATFDKAKLRRVAERIGITGDRLDRVIESINYQGYMIKKKGGSWQLQSSSFSQGR